MIMNVHAGIALSFLTPFGFSGAFNVGVHSDIKRGMRLLNQRRQILIQDEFTGTAATAEWRMQTNATISYSSDKRTANLELGGQKMSVQILSSAPNLTFNTQQAL